MHSRATGGKTAALLVEKWTGKGMRDREEDFTVGEGDDEEECIWDLHGARPKMEYVRRHRPAWRAGKDLQRPLRLRLVQSSVSK